MSRILRAARARDVGLERFASLPAAVLSGEYRLPSRAVSRLTRERGTHEARCRALLHEMTAARIALRTAGDDGYPERWRSRLGDGEPGFVFLLGNLALPARSTVGLLSSREISGETVAAAAEVARAAAVEGFAVVTSGTKGTYRISTTAARACAAPRLVVLDRGILAAFGGQTDTDPFGTGVFRRRLDTENTLVLSTFRLHDHAAPSNGQRRDELVAALSDVIVAAGVRDGGGIERTCLRALDRGQCVLSWGAANAALLAAGAIALDREDLRSGLGRFLQSG